MFDHQKILDKIETIRSFFQSIGLKEIESIPENWNLDSSYHYVPIENHYTINWKGEERILTSVNIFLVGGIHFMLSGKMRNLVSETIQTDYDLKSVYHTDTLFKKEFRDWKIKQLV